MSQRDYSSAVREAKKLERALREGSAAAPLMSARTREHRAGDGGAAVKTLTQAVKAAEAARDEARAARLAAEAAAKHADEVCGRSVALCGCWALVSLLPWAVRLAVQVARWVFSML